MSTSREMPVPAVPEAAWIPRWLAEMEAPLFDAGGSALAGEERNVLELALAASRPWTLFGMQLAMANLALTHAGDAQLAWTQAWCEAWRGMVAPALGAQGAARCTPGSSCPWTAARPAE